MKKDFPTVVTVQPVDLGNVDSIDRAFSSIIHSCKKADDVWRYSRGILINNAGDVNPLASTKDLPVRKIEEHAKGGSFRTSERTRSWRGA